MTLQLLRCATTTAAQRGSGQFGGFYIQQPRADANPSTSEGLFVYAPDSAAVALQPGDYVQVQGPVGLISARPTPAAHAARVTR